MGKLTGKRLRFAQEYPKDHNATKAATRAGYSKKTAYSQGQRLLKNVEIKAAIDKAIHKVEEKAIVDAAYVLASLKEVAERCMQRVPVMEFDRENRRMVQAQDDDGKGIWEFDSAGANKALELLGKSMKLFTDKVEHFGKLSLEQLAAEAANDSPGGND